LTLILMFLNLIFNFSIWIQLDRRHITHRGSYFTINKSPLMSSFWFYFSLRLFIEDKIFVNDNSILTKFMKVGSCQKRMITKESQSSKESRFWLLRNFAHTWQIWFEDHWKQQFPECNFSPCIKSVELFG
jgi:hypothetical protein